MEEFADLLISKQRVSVDESCKLKKLEKSKLLSILKRTEIPVTSLSVFEECWIWNGTQLDDKKGRCHGIVWVDRKYVMVHRLMYHNFIEDVPAYKRSSTGLQVNHKCTHIQNGRCINPWHCYLGTSKDNTSDSIREDTKYKVPSGETNPKAILSDAMIQEIKQLKLTTTLPQKEIAKLYGVHQSQISRWWNGITRK